MPKDKKAKAPKSPKPVKKAKQASTKASAKKAEKKPKKDVKVEKPKSKEKSKKTDYGTKKWYRRFCCLGLCCPYLTACYIGLHFKERIIQIFKYFLLFVISLALENIILGYCITEETLTSFEDDWLDYYDFICEHQKIIAAVFAVLTTAVFYTQRRKFIRLFRIDENPILTCLIVNFCYPCSFGQIGTHTVHTV